MPTRTSIASGYWSDVAIWDTGVPVDGDTVVVSGGHTVLFDVNQSAMVSGMAGIRVYGTLGLTEASGTYYLKMTGTATHNISLSGGAGVGHFIVGSSGSPVPWETKFTVDLGQASTIHGGSFTGGGNCHWYGEGPTPHYVTIISGAATTATSFLIDTNLVGNKYWKDDGTTEVFLCAKNSNFNTGSFQFGYIVSGGITSGSVSLSVSGGGTTASVSGGYIFLITRNLFIQTCKNTNYNSIEYFGDINADRLILSGVRVDPASAISGRLVGNNYGRVVLKGKTIIGRGFYCPWNSDHIRFEEDCVIYGVNRPFTLRAGGNKPMVCIMKDRSIGVHLLEGSNGHNICTTFAGSAQIINSRTVISGGAGTVIRDNVNIEQFREIGSGVYYIGKNVRISYGLGIVFQTGESLGKFYQTRVGYPERVTAFAPGYTQRNLYVYGGAVSGNAFTPHTNSYLGLLSHRIGTSSEFFNNMMIYHEQDASGNIEYGKLRGFTSGGTVSVQTPPILPSENPYSFYNSFTYQSSAYYNYVDFPLPLEKDTKVKILCTMQNTISGNFTVLPQIQLVDANTDVNSASGTIVSSAQMLDNTSWQTLGIEYTALARRNLVFRICGAAGSGITYFNHKIDFYTISEGNRGIKSGGDI